MHSTKTRYSIQGKEIFITNILKHMQLTNIVLVAKMTKLILLDSLLQEIK